MPSRSTAQRFTTSSQSFFASPEEAVRTPTLVWVTDLALLAAITVVPACFGGRSALGQTALVVTALLAAAAWSLHQMLAHDRRWIWTGSEILWIAAFAVTGLQLAELPPTWLAQLAPHSEKLLGEWSNGTVAGVFPHGWSTLSLSPAETQTGLAMFAAYALLFFVAVQRMHELGDVERLLRWLALAAVAMAAFSLLQYAFGNGKFFWVIHHPFVQTTRYNLGSFTNRNHLAHFLALGTGPLLWWWLKTVTPDPQRPNVVERRFLGVLLLGALSLVSLAALLSLSRGGLLGMGVTVFVSLVAFQRAGRASGQFVLGLIAAAVVIGGGFWMAGSQELAQRIDEAGHNDRVQIWQANLRIAQDYPWFGTGVGSHLNVHHLYLDRGYDRHEYTHAESSYLQVASETGLAGLICAGLMTLCVLLWTLSVVLRRVDADYAAAGGAVLGSLCGHLVHAVVDFLWYIPGLMVIVALLAAIARRLSQLDRQSQGRLAVPWRPSIVWPGLVLCGLAMSAPWLMEQVTPGVAAEPHWRRYLTLVYFPWELYPADDSPDQQEAVSRDKCLSAVRAAKADPHNSRLQAAAALAYLATFDARQRESDMPMTLLQLRDAVRASEFDSPAEMRKWLQRAVGKNLKLLDSAWHSARRAVLASPLEAPAYISLAELSFLHDPRGDLKRRLIHQAVTVRPFDPHVQFAAGEEALLDGDEPTAMTHWRDAFHRGEVFQRKIARLLAPAKPADFVLQTFEPDWRAMRVLIEAYNEAGRTDELAVLLQAQVESAIRAAQELPEEASEPAWLAARHACLTLERQDLAIQTLQDAVKQLPHSVELRRALGIDLYHQQRFAEAADHLRWASQRRLDDPELRRLAEQAIREGLRNRTTSRVQPAGFESR